MSALPASANRASMFINETSRISITAFVSKQVTIGSLLSVLVMAYINRKLSRLASLTRQEPSKTRETRNEVCWEFLDQGVMVGLSDILIHYASEEEYQILGF